MAEIDITDRVHSFREAARHLWNTWFHMSPEEGRDWNLRDAYSEVYVALFNAMVKHHLPAEAASIPHLWSDESEMSTQYRVETSLEVLPILINRDLEAGGYWDHPTKRVRSDSTKLGLVGIFDWDEVGFRDFRYFRVTILEAGDQELVGRDALVEASDARVIFDNGIS